MASFNRVYTHKRFGEIASIDIDFPTEGWAINGTALPERAVQHLVRHATQSLLDAYAGAKNAAEAKSAFDKKFDRILGGEIGIRATGPRNPVRTRAIELATRNMTGKTQKERREKAVALVDATPNSIWLELAAESIANDEALAARAGLTVDDMVADGDESDETDDAEAA